MTLFSGTPRVRQAKAIWVIIGAVYLYIWSLPLWNQYGPGHGIGTDQALSLLRDPDQFKWYIIPLFLIVLYIAMNELDRGNVKAVLAASAFFLMDFFNEIWNGLYYTATGFAAVWQVGSPSAYKPLIGWNIEIMFMFFLCGLASTKLLPKDKDRMFFGCLNNRHFFAVLCSALSVLAEILIHKMGFITWNYWWWQPEFPWVLFIIGYMPFYEILYLVYDLPSVKSQATIVGSMALVLAPSFILLTAAGWI